MNEQRQLNYNRIAEAIEYIKNNFKEQPSLDKVAEQVHLSPFHFQRLFSEWAGTTPKKFLQYISIEHAKKLLKEQQATLFNTAAILLLFLFLVIVLFSPRAISAVTCGAIHAKQLSSAGKAQKQRFLEM
jgi:AraC-like DNA-binding protein